MVAVTQVIRKSLKFLGKLLVTAVGVALVSVVTFPDYSAVQRIEYGLAIGLVVGVMVEFTPLFKRSDR